MSMMKWKTKRKKKTKKKKPKPRRASMTQDTTQFYRNLGFVCKSSVGKRGGVTVLMVDGNDDTMFRYVSYHRKKNTHTFRCCDRNCLARAKMEGQVITLYGTHSCDEDTEDEEDDGDEQSNGRRSFHRRSFQSNNFGTNSRKPCGEEDIMRDEDCEPRNESQNITFGIVEYICGNDNVQNEVMEGLVMYRYDFEGEKQTEKQHLY